MPTTPYFIPLSIALGANATNSLQFQVPQNQTLHISHWRWSSTGAFIIYDLRIGSSIRVTSASQSTGIPNTFLQNPANANISIADFDVPWTIGPTLILYIDLKDTSGAGNTVTCVLFGTMDLPGS